MAEPARLSRCDWRRSLRHQPRDGIGSVAQRRRGLRAQGGCVVHHGQARAEIRLQLQPLHEEPAVVWDTATDCTPSKATTALQYSGASSAVQGDAMMDMLLGLAGSYNQQRALPIRHYVNQTPSVYAMDTLARNTAAVFAARACAMTRCRRPGSATTHCELQPGPLPGQRVSTVEHGRLDGYDRARLLNVYGGRLNRSGLRERNRSCRPGGRAARAGEQLLQHVAASHRLLRGPLRERQDGSPWRLWDLLRAPAGQPDLQQRYGVTVLALTNGQPGLLQQPAHQHSTGATASTPFFPGGQYEMAQHFPDPAVAMYSLGIQHQLSPSVVWVVQYVGN